MLLLCMWMGEVAMHTHASLNAVTGAASAKQFETQMVLRDLWVEHVFWVRNYVKASHNKDQAAVEVASAEIVANAQAIAGSIQPFYGEAASKKLFELLAGHWGAVKAYSDATFVKDSGPQRKAAVKQLTENAKAISGFLSGANPHLPEADLFGLLAAHGAHHVQQIDQIKAADWSGESQTWHAMRSHMLIIADALVGALAQQFPNSF